MFHSYSLRPSCVSATTTTKNEIIQMSVAGSLVVQGAPIVLTSSSSLRVQGDFNITGSQLVIPSEATVTIAGIEESAPHQTYLFFIGFCFDRIADIERGLDFGVWHRWCLDQFLGIKD